MSELDTKAAELMAKMEAAEADAETANYYAKRALVAEAKLALVERYGADQWRRGNAGQEPQEFDEWQKEAQP